MDDNFASALSSWEMSGDEGAEYCKQCQLRGSTQKTVEMDVLHYLLHRLFCEFLLSLRTLKGYWEWLNKLFEWSLMIFSFKNGKITIDAVRKLCLYAHIYIIWSLSFNTSFSGSSLEILSGDALLSAHYQQLKNFQFSAHSVLVKIEYISFPLYRVENLWFMVCWNSSCYIQNAPPGSSNNAQGLSTVNSPCFLFSSFPTLLTWRYFVLIFSSRFLEPRFLFVKSNIFPSYILCDTIWPCFKMFFSSCI